MKIALASDHAGFDYKQVIKHWLTERCHGVKDLGTFRIWRLRRRMKLPRHLCER